MSRFLPPLLVILVLAAIGVRCALEPYRVEARERIAGLVQGGASEDATRLLEDYVARFDGEDDTWYATRMWFRMGKPVRGIDAVWNHPDLPSRPATARRFAETALLALGWKDEARTEASSLEPYALIALVEDENPWADQRLDEHIATLDLRGTTAYFFPAYRLASSRPGKRILAAYRRRPDDRFPVAAALAALRREAYPERAQDHARLVKVLGDHSWRQQFRSVWCVAALALGRAEDEEGRAALARAAAELEGSTNVRDNNDLLLVRNGQLAGGNFDVVEEIARAAFSAEPPMMVTIWWLEALIHRYHLGDERSELWLRRIWEELGPRFPDLRERAAKAFLLHDEAPDAAALAEWVERMRRDLEHPDAPLSGHVVARASRLRQGLPGAREELIEILRAAATRLTTGGAEGSDAARPIIEALRALYLYG